MMFAVPQAIDEYELVDPIDILTPLEKSGFWDGVVSVSLSLSPSIRCVISRCAL